MNMMDLKNLKEQERNMGQEVLDMVSDQLTIWAQKGYDPLPHDLVCSKEVRNKMLRVAAFQSIMKNGGLIG